MTSHVRENLEFLLTKFTRERSFARVVFKVIRQTFELTIGFVTFGTLERLLFSVGNLMFLETVFCSEIFSTFNT